MFEQMTKPEKERLAIRYISVEQQNIMRDFSEGKISKEEAEDRTKNVWEIWDKVVNGIGNFTKDEIEKIGMYISSFPKKNDVYKNMEVPLSAEMVDKSGKLIPINARMVEENVSEVEKKAIIDNRYGDFLVDSNGNVVINPNSGIPYPRYRRVDETDQEYNEFLKNYYAAMFPVEKEEATLASPSLVNGDKQKKPLGIKDKKTPPLMIEDKQKKSSENREPSPKPLEIEDKQPKPLRIEDKKTPPLMIEDKQKKPLGIEDKGAKKKKEPPTKKEPKTPKKGLITIINELTKGLEIKKKTGKRYTASNISVSKQFKAELQSGNYLYNITSVAQSIVKGVSLAIRKVAGKITLSKEQKENMNTLMERLDDLMKNHEQEFLTIYNEYRGSRVIQERFPTAINVAINKKVEEYTLGKLNKLNEKNKKGYQEIFNSYEQLKAVDNALRNPKITEEKKEKYRNYRNKLLEGKAELVRQIRMNYMVANQWMSGGQHGFSEDMKAAATKLNYVGKRFAKDHDLDHELTEQEARLEQAENAAIAKGDNEQALKAFVGMEQLLSQETEIKNSIFGKRSTGKKYYSPLAEQLNYQDDPFVRNIFQTIALVGAGVSAWNGIRTHLGQDRQQQDLLNDTIQQVNEKGREIVSKQETFSEGMEAQIYQDINNIHNTIERQALDKSAETYGDWVLGSDEYHQADAIEHEYTSNLYSTTSDRLVEITNQYTSGAMTQAQAMQAITNVARETQNSLQELIGEYMPSLQSYAASHPQFDLSALNGAMNYMINHPDAIPKMYEAMNDVTEIGEELAGLTVQNIQALQELPNDLSTTLFGAASAAALAWKVSNAAGNVRKRSYGNELTEMVEESYNKEEAPKARVA